MSDGAGVAAPGANPFNPKTLAAIVFAGIVGFVTFLLLVAYASELRGGGDPRPHAMSNSAVGFRGIVRLIELGNGIPYLITEPGDLWTEDLVVVTVDERTSPEALRSLVEERAAKPTLIVLPKWEVMTDPERSGWVRALGPRETGPLAQLLDGVADVRIAQERGRSRTATGSGELDGFAAPAPELVQTVSGESLTALLSAGGGALLARVGDAPLYILAEPDLLNNQGIAEAASARAALDLLARLNSNAAETVSFDLTLSGYSEQRNALRLAFDPPFLALTLALFVAALLAGLHGAARFGAPAEDAPALPFGKSALVENSASLFKLAKREHRAGGAYAELIREAAAHETGAHLALRDSDLDSYLDRVSPPEGPRFSALAEQARGAAERGDLVAAARALFQWKKDLIR